MATSYPSPHASHHSQFTSLTITQWQLLRVLLQTSNEYSYLAIKYSRTLILGCLIRARVYALFVHFGYTTSFHLCALFSCLCGLLFHLRGHSFRLYGLSSFMSAGSILSPSPIGRVAHKNKKKSKWKELKSLEANAYEGQ